MFLLDAPGSPHGVQCMKGETSSQCADFSCFKKRIDTVDIGGVTFQIVRPQYLGKIYGIADYGEQ